MAEYQVVLKETGFITDTIAAGGKAGLITLAGHLLGEDLITQQLHAAVIGGYGDGPHSDAAKILAEVQNKIKYAPKKFDDFLKALRNSDLGDVANRLESDCREFSLSPPLFPSPLTFSISFSSSCLPPLSHTYMHTLSPFLSLIKSS